jgi:hypothetical protein
VTLAARIAVVTPTAPAEVVVDLAPHPRSGKLAREAVVGLADHLHPETMAKVRLLVTELVVAVLVPAEGDVLRLCVRLEGELVRAELGPAAEGAQLTGTARPRRWNLFLVNRIADRWGADEGGVWFELKVR